MERSEEEVFLNLITYCKYCVFLVFPKTSTPPFPNVAMFRRMPLKVHILDNR